MKNRSVDQANLVAEAWIKAKQKWIFRGNQEAPDAALFLTAMNMLPVKDRETLLQLANEEKLAISEKNKKDWEQIQNYLKTIKDLSKLDKFVY